MRLGIVQAPIRRASSGAGLSVALYAPCRHLQQPADRAREDERDLIRPDSRGEAELSPSGESRPAGTS